VSRTNLVQLDGEEFRTAVTEQLLCLAAVGTVGLGEDGDGVLVDDGLDFGLCGGHGGGAGGAVEEAGEEGYGCGSRGPEPVGLGVGWLDGLLGDGSAWVWRSWSAWGWGETDVLRDQRQVARGALTDLLRCVVCEGRVGTGTAVVEYWVESKP